MTQSHGETSPEVAADAGDPDTVTTVGWTAIVIGGLVVLGSSLVGSSVVGRSVVEPLGRRLEMASPTEPLPHAAAPTSRDPDSAEDRHPAKHGPPCAFVPLR